MDYNLILFLPAVIIFGVLTCYTDIKQGKIKNKHILAAVLYALIVYTLIILFFVINKTPINLSYIIEMITNASISLIVGFLIWIVGLWTAGDSKLFFAYTLLIPVSIYQHGYVPYFPSIVLLVNTFVPAFLAIFLILLVKTSTRQKVDSLKNTFQPMKIINTAISLFGLWWVIASFFSILSGYNKLFYNLANNYFAIILFVFISIILLERTFKKPIIIFLLLSFIRLLVDRAVYNLQFIINFFLLLLFFLIFRFFILDLTFAFYTRNVDIGLLRAGMIPAEIVYAEKGEYRKRRVLNFDVINYFSAHHDKRQIFGSSSDGLTKREVDEIKRLYVERKINFDHLLVYQQLPFAPFLFFGALSTILLKGSLFSFFPQF